MKHFLLLFCVLLLYSGIVGRIALAEDSSVLVRESKVVQQAVSETLTVYGQVWADPDAVLTVSLSHAGLITHVAARLGQRVKRGEALFELAISPEAYKQYFEARSSVDYAQRELDRQQHLFAEQLAVKAQVEAARKALEDARAGLQSLTAQKQNKILETVSAPTDGIVTELAVKQGDRVQGGAAALAIASGNRLIALLGVEPEDIHLLHPGTPVRISSVFVKGYKVESQLREVHAMINPATHLVDALVPIPEGQTDHLVLGSRLTAEIPLNAHTGLTVPRDAVLQDQQGSYVFRVVNGRAERVEVSTGLENDKWVEIVRGLNSYDSVVSVGNYELTDGMLVREGR
jgi:membrane fusion protein, multidrug efflux system